MLEISHRFSQKKTDLPFTSVTRAKVAAMKNITSFPSWDKSVLPCYQNQLTPRPNEELFMRRTKLCELGSRKVGRLAQLISSEFSRLVRRLTQQTES